MNSARLFHRFPVPQILCLVVAVALTACVSTSHKKAQSLFDGKTLNGWVQHGQAKYAAEDGCIVGTSVKSSGNSFLCTEKTFSDFTLELEVKAHTNLNSGIQIRSHCYDYPTNFVWEGKTKTIPAGRVHGYQVEVDNRPERRWSGGIYEEARREWMQNLTNKPVAQAAFKFGEWNKYRIECIGPSIKTWVNGVPTADLHDSVASEGFIGLQVHGNKEAGLEVRFRNIYLQDLSKAK